MNYKTYNELKNAVREIFNSIPDKDMEYSFSYSTRFRTNRLQIRFSEMSLENIKLISDICELGFLVYQSLDKTVKECEGKHTFNLSAKYF